MQYKTEPYEWQKKCVEMAEEHRDLAVLADMGCLTGDTVIRASFGGCSYNTTLYNLHKKFHSPNRKKEIKVRSKKEVGIGLNIVKYVQCTGEKECYEITCDDGKVLKGTGDHKILTIHGWRELKNTLYEYVMIEIPKIRVPKQRYNLRCVGSKHIYSQKATVRGKAKRRIEIHRAVYEAYINKMTLEKYLEATYTRDDLKYIDPSKYHIHHKDLDVKNNAISNLEKLTPQEHALWHLKTYTNKSVGVAKVIEIKAIGKRRTYDISMADPFNNYIANKIVVHNTGKTKCVIDIIRARCMDKSRLRKTLILGPVSVLFNWPDEFRIHSSISLKDIVVLHKSGKARVKMLQDFIHNRVTDKWDRNCIVVANYEAINNKEVLKTLLEWQPEILVCDESHLVKSHESQRSQNTYKIAKGCGHRYIMTGTAILNSPMDIFMQYKILDLGKTFGTNFYIFQRKYFTNVSPPWLSYPTWEPQKEKFPEINKKIYHKAIRVMKSECLDLPPRITQTVYVSLSTKQQKAYKEMKRDFITFLADQEKEGKSKAVVAQLAVTKALRLMQIVTGHVTAEDKSIIDFGNIPRLQATKDILEQVTPNHKIILWCSFVHNYKQLAQLCKEVGVEYVFITGQQNAKEKQESIERFRQDAKVRVVIANRRAGGVGINLIEASYSLIYSRNFSLAEEKQSEDRNYRGGSEIHERIVKVELCAKDTIDELAIQALRNKEDISKSIIDLARRL